FDNDGTTDSTSRNPSCTYGTAGTYTVRLTVTNAAGSDTMTRTDYITVTPAAPVAAFSADDTTPDVGQTVVFSDASTNTPTSWSWTIEGTSGTDFEYVDSTSASSQHPHVRFLTAGTYDVNLTATNAGGSDTESKTDYITVTPAVVAPVAAFEGTPTSGTAPLTVQFTDASTGDITGWAWDFDNDGTTDSTSRNPSCTYSAAGTYTVSLTVTNAGGSDTESKTDYITVTPAAPVAAFSVDDTTPDVGQTVVFSDASTNTPTSWSWTIEGTSGTDFEYVDSTSASSQHPHVRFLTAGTYDVNLTATNAGGSDTESKTDYITVTATPATIEVTLSQSSVPLGAMSVGTPGTGSIGVTVTTTGGTAWSVTASASGDGYMRTGGTPLANPIELANGDGPWHPLNTGFTGFMTGAAGVGRTDTAKIRQTVSSADAPGDYAITITFTGAVS
ncbi:MAG TPA: PKD domain-containing protein, partial [Methanoregulaceae archaeon]|nr:PKD domain-containing protein [Methanoregulaceae archaeon]